MRIPELEEKISCPHDWRIGTSPRNRINLRKVREVLHTVCRPCVPVCASELDTRRNRVGIGLVDDRCSDGKDVVHGAVHVDVWEDRSTGDAPGSAAYICVLAK